MDLIHNGSAKTQRNIDMSEKTLGEFIREARKRKRASIVQIAKAAEISTSFLSDIERGRRSPSDPVLERLAKSLGIKAEALRELNTVGAFWEFREFVEKHYEVNLAFVGMVRRLKLGKLSASDLVKRFSD